MKKNIKNPMLQRTITRSLVFMGCAALCACDQLPGKPKESDRWLPPEANKDFASLYGTNCVACHSDGKTVSASIGMNNALYLSILPKEVLHKLIAEGLHGTTMPGFSKAAGGELTDDQIIILVDGITAWGAAKGEAGKEGDKNLPPYSAPLGNETNGATAFAQNCATCHGKDGVGGDKAGSVVDPTYLSLVSDQYLRSVVIAGRPDLGMPNYQEDVHGTPMNSDQIADVVAWLSSHRPRSTIAIDSPVIPKEAPANSKEAPGTEAPMTQPTPSK
jgi:cytochrome c oxidase cbb3-type subunit 3